MALTKQELRADASKMYDEAEAILTAETVAPADAEKAAGLQAEAEALEARAASLEAIETRKAALGKSAVTRPATAKSEDRSADEPSLEVREAKAFRSFLNGNEAEIRSLNTLAPEDGGVFVPTTLSNQIIEVASKVGPMLSGQCGQVWNSATGNDFDIPRGDDRDGEAYEVAEGADHPDTDFNFDKVTFKAVEYGTGIVPITNQMKRDGTYDLNGYVVRAFGKRIGRTWNKRFTNGTGVDQPLGLVTGLKAQGSLIRTAATTGITFQDLMNLEEDLEEAYLEGSVYMLNRKRLNSFRSLVDANGDPVIWQGRYTEGAPATILGRNYVINNDVADDEIVLGSLNDAFTMRLIGQLTIKTSSEIFFRKNMDGIAGFASADSKVTNPAAARVLKVKSA